MDLAVTALGLLVLVLLAMDVFVTVLHPVSGAGPWTRRQNRLIWTVVRRTEVTLSGGRSSLSLAAPVMALTTPAAWVVLLTVGFGLLYMPVVDAFSVQPPSDMGPRLTAFYYSGYLTSTLGLGDVVPEGAIWRMATVVHSALGFALFSAAITYILSIYGRQTEDAALAVFVRGAFPDEPVDPDEGAGDAAEPDATVVAQVAARLASVNVAHHQYPILHYFHVPPESSLVVQTGRLVSWIEAVPVGRERDAAVRALGTALDEFVDQMPFETGAADGQELVERHRALLRAHGYGD